MTKTMIQGRFESKKDGLRQTQDGLWKITLTVHPDEDLGPMLSAAMGTRFMVAYAEIGDDEQPVQEPKQRTPFRELPRSQQAGVLCASPTFQQWASHRADCPLNAAATAEWVREYCEIASRADFDKHTEAAMRWDNCLAEFETETGRRAERHG